MINQELNQTQKNNFIALIEPPIIEKRGIAKRSDNFLETVENGKRFEEIQKEYAYFKNDAKRILNDNQRNLGLNQSEVCILNTLVTFSSVKSWAEGKPICTARNSRIAEKAGYSTGTISNKLKSLEDKGFIYRSYNQFNQRVGVEPISLAPFGSMLSKWEDEGLMQWKLNKKEQITGKKQTKQKIMITRDDKIEYKKQTKSLYISKEDLAEINCIEGSSNSEPRSTNSCTNKYYNKNTHVKKTIQKKENSQVNHADYWSDKTWSYYDKLITNYDIEDLAILDAFEKRSPILMHNATIDFLRRELSDFNIRLLHKAIHGKLSTSLWRVGLMILYSLNSSKVESKLKFLALGV